MLGRGQDVRESTVRCQHHRADTIFGGWKIPGGKDNRRLSRPCADSSLFGTCSIARECISGLYGQARIRSFRPCRGGAVMVASIGKIASPAQGVSYFEKDGYYAKDDGAHREASAWARGGGRRALSGLRLGDGALMLRIEREGQSVKVRLPRGAVFPEDGGLLLVREVATIEGVWLGAPVPRPGRGRRRTEEDGDRELLLALESEAEGLTRHEVAERLWGRERVAEEYYDGRKYILSAYAGYQ